MRIGWLVWMAAHRIRDGAPSLLVQRDSFTMPVGHCEMCKCWLGIHEGAVHMQIITIGLDIAKNVFQVHGVDAEEKVVVRKQLRRSQVLRFFEELSPCLWG